MKFSIVIYSSPASSQAAATALKFTRTLLDEGHEIYRLFFFADGVHNTTRMAVSAQDETNIPEQWHTLITNYELESVACVSSAIKRGILDDREAERYDKGSSTLHTSSEIAGLGQLVDAALQSDRLVQFG